MKFEIKARYPNLGNAALASIGFAAAFCMPLTCSANETPTATLTYRSVFSEYKKLENFTEPRPTAWKLANDRVEKVGGWREYAKEAARADAAPVLPNVPPTIAPIVVPKPSATIKHDHHGEKP